MRLVLLMCISLFISGCLTQNIQHGNPTGKVSDNRWDYYNGTPTHYTSFIRSGYVGGVETIRENTDAFSGTYNLPLSSDRGSVIYNGVVASVVRTDASSLWELDDEWQNATQYYNRFYKTEDGKVMVAVNDIKQIVVTSFVVGKNERNDIAYYPSRFLACKKIAQLQQAASAQMMSDLLKTALVAGVQSYTSYQTYQGSGNVYGQYGNFGYTQTGTYRDYSWAGARASDALDTLFAGSGDSTEIRTAWQSLNCW